MKNIASRLKNQEFTEHIEEMQLALFVEKRLGEKEREEVFQHLAKCQQCRDVLKIASEIKAQEQKQKPANNLNYRGALKRLGVVAVLALVFILPSQLTEENQPTFKGICEEKSMIEEAILYWEDKFEGWFGEGG